MASHRPRSNSSPPKLSHDSTAWPNDYSPLQGPRAIRLLFIDSPLRDFPHHFFTGRLGVVNLQDFERKYVALSYTWGPAIREGFSEPEDASRLTPPYDFLIAAHHTEYSLDDCNLHDGLRAKLEHGSDSTSMRLAPNLSGYFTYHAKWHIKEDVSIWIDAICINQQDPVEVAEQILLQSDIYTMARQTNVWLGACQRDLSTFEWWQDTVYQALIRERDRHRQSPYLFDLTFKTGDHLNAQFWIQNSGL